MSAFRIVRRSLLTWSLILIAAGLSAQTQTGQYQPQSGQEGKDVVWVPTVEPLVHKMLDIAKVTPQDLVIDLGSGDGRTVINAAKRGAHSVGIEYNPDMVELSKRTAAREGVADRATFIKDDLFETDLSKATVITMFLLPEINLRLRPKLLDLKPGTRIVSNTFTMEEWKADETATVDGPLCTSWCTALLWIVPAKVEGTWKLPVGTLTLKQQFQIVSGSLKSGADGGQISSGRLRGDQITFSVGGAHYTGRVNGTSMEGTVTANGRTSNWSATRTGA